MMFFDRYRTINSNNPMAIAGTSLNTMTDLIDALSTQPTRAA